MDRENKRESQERWRRKNSKKIAAYHKKYYAKFKKQYLQGYRDSYRKRRVVCLEWYGGVPPSCACCGESVIQFLTINHTDGRYGSGNKHRKSLDSMEISRWLVRNDFPDGFNVLCHNCNSASGHYGECPHESLRKKLKPN